MAPIAQLIVEVLVMGLVAFGGIWVAHLRADRDLRSLSGTIAAPWLVLFVAFAASKVAVFLNRVSADYWPLLFGALVVIGFLTIQKLGRNVAP